MNKCVDCIGINLRPGGNSSGGGGINPPDTGNSGGARVDDTIVDVVTVKGAHYAATTNPEADLSIGHAGIGREVGQAGGVTHQQVTIGILGDAVESGRTSRARTPVPGAVDVLFHLANGGNRARRGNVEGGGVLNDDIGYGGDGYCHGPTGAGVNGFPHGAGASSGLGEDDGAIGRVGRAQPHNSGIVDGHQGGYPGPARAALPQALWSASGRIGGYHEDDAIGRVGRGRRRVLDVGDCGVNQSRLVEGDTAVHGYREGALCASSPGIDGAAGGEIRCRHHLGGRGAGRCLASSYPGGTESSRRGISRAVDLGSQIIAGEEGTSRRCAVEGQAGKGGRPNGERQDSGRSIAYAPDVVSDATYRGHIGDTCQEVHAHVV